MAAAVYRTAPGQWRGVHEIMDEARFGDSPEKLAYLRGDSPEARHELDELREAIDAKPIGPTINPRQIWILLRCDAAVYPVGPDGKLRTPLQYLYDVCPPSGPPCALYKLCSTCGSRPSDIYVEPCIDLQKLMVGALLPRHAAVARAFVREVGAPSRLAVVQPIANRWAMHDRCGHDPDGKDPGGTSRCAVVEALAPPGKARFNQIDLGTYFCGAPDDGWTGCPRCLERLVDPKSVDQWVVERFLRLVDECGGACILPQRAAAAIEWLRDNWRFHDFAARYLVQSIAGEKDRYVLDGVAPQGFNAGFGSFKSALRLPAVSRYGQKSEDLPRLQRIMTYGLAPGRHPDEWNEAVPLRDLAERVNGGMQRAVHLACDLGFPVNVYGSTDRETVMSEDCACGPRLLLRHPQLFWKVVRQDDADLLFGKLMRMAKNPANAIVHMTARGDLKDYPTDSPARYERYSRLCIELDRFVKEPKHPDVQRALDALSERDVAWVLKKARRLEGTSHVAPVALALRERHCATLAAGRMQEQSPLSLLDDALLLRIARISATSRFDLT